MSVNGPAYEILVFVAYVQLLYFVYVDTLCPSQNIQY